MSTFGDKIYEFGGVPMGGIFQTEPNSTIWLKASGSAGADGKTPKKAVSTLTRAHTLIPADKNGVVYLVAEDNSASGTTIRISGATETWSKDGTKLIGVASGSQLGSRARIGNTADATDVSPLMTWSASNGSMQNIHLFYGEADAGDLGAFLVSGERNYFRNCHWGGIGDATQDAAGAYSLSVTGDENLFENCTIGIDTVGRGTAANSELLFPASGAATRNIFRNCLFLTYADAATHQFITAGTGSLDRWALFDNCTFINSVDAGATAMSEVIDASASLGGGLYFKDCAVFGATEWEAGDTGEVLVMGGTGIAGSTGAGGSGISIEPS